MTQTPELATPINYLDPTLSAPVAAIVGPRPESGAISYDSDTWSVDYELLEESERRLIEVIKNLPLDENLWRTVLKPWGETSITVQQVELGSRDEEFSTVFDYLWEVAKEYPQLQVELANYVEVCSLLAEQANRYGLPVESRMVAWKDFSVVDKDLSAVDEAMFIRETVMIMMKTPEGFKSFTEIELPDGTKVYAEEYSESENSEMGDPESVGQFAGNIEKIYQIFKVPPFVVTSVGGRMMTDRNPEATFLGKYVVNFRIGKNGQKEFMSSKYLGFGGLSGLDGPIAQTVEGYRGDYVEQVRKGFLNELKDRYETDGSKMDYSSLLAMHWLDQGTLGHSVGLSEYDFMNRIKTPQPQKEKTREQTRSGEDIESWRGWLKNAGRRRGIGR